MRRNLFDAIQDILNDVKMSEKKKKDKELAKVHPELEGFDVSINPLGEIVRTIDIDKINDFLNKKLYDKKLRNRPEGSEDLPEESDFPEKEE